MPAGPTAPNTGQLLYWAHRLARGRANRALRPLGIDLRGLGVLATLAECAPLSQRKLSGAIDLDKSSMVLLVDALERAGLVARTRNKHDRRAYAVQLTDTGRERLALAQQHAAATLNDLLAPFSAGQRVQLNDLLAEFVAYARAKEMRDVES